MGALTEQEIFDRMRESFRSAIQHSLDLAVQKRKGASYDALRRDLLLIEGCCRQAAQWRADFRYLGIGLAMHECHDRAGGWLRGIKFVGEQTRRKVPDKHLHPLFIRLAELLREQMKNVQALRTMRTSKLGPVLPDVMPAPGVRARPVTVRLPDRVTAGGIILPSCARAS